METLDNGIHVRNVTMESDLDRGVVAVGGCKSSDIVVVGELN